MSTDRYELSDVSVKYKQESDNSLNTSTEVGGAQKKNGMYISTAKAFILAFLAIAVAVGVGIIVHFAGSSKNVACTCHYPTTKSPTDQEAQKQCVDWAKDGNTEICSACSGGTTCPPTPSVQTTTPVITTTKAPPLKDVRLPLDLEPVLYKVELQPNMYDGEPSAFTFTGSISIEIRCKQTTSNITMHMKKLNITSNISVKQQNGIQELYSSHSEDKKREFLIINTNINLNPGSIYVVSMTFVGPLAPDLAGLYLSSYKRGNETIYIATSQLQATDARKTFPCYDEPAIKAQFDVTLVRKSHMKTLSNMPIREQEPRYTATSFLAPVYARKAFPCMDEPALKAQFDVILVRKETKISISNMPVKTSVQREDGWIADHFERTPIMSTYLLAMIVCDFEYTQKNTTNGIEYRAWARPEALDQTPYGLDVGAKILTYYEEFFNISYPLPKQDMIALPDFAAGAMENWGLITYRETAMLYKPGVSSEGNKQRVAIVVSHELAHQWFGNLVTPSWWDDLWLNEGFATYIEYMGVDLVEPEWKMFEQIVISELHDAFNFDGLISSHPVYVPVYHPDEINEIFDRISYAKGAAIIRMMRFFLGDAVFKHGMTRYLNSLRYGAAFHDDLWFALGNQSKAENGKITNVKEIMDTWTLQMNYPTVMVRYTEPGKITVSQSRYLRDYNATDPGKYVSPYGYKWEIPFTYTTSTQKRFDVSNNDIVMMNRHGGQDNIYDTTNIPDPNANNGRNWVIGNCLQYGYYRMNYDDRNWMALIEQLKENHEVIPTVNRAQIINDAWNLAKSGDLDMKIALRTTEYLGSETEYVAWSAASDELGFVSTMLKRNPLYGEYSKFMRSIVSGPFRRLGMNNTGAPHLESFLRSALVALACRYDIQECIDEAKQLFSQWMADPDNNPIDPGIKSAVYCKAIAEGGEEEWDFVFKRYKTENLAAEKVRLQAALSCSKETWILKKYLEMTLDENEIRRQDAVSIIAHISRNTIGRQLAWDFFRENWDHFFAEECHNHKPQPFPDTKRKRKQTKPNKRKSNKLIVRDGRHNFLQDFIKSKSDLGSGARAFDQALEKTKGNIQWMDKNVPIIAEWLRERTS